MPHPIHLGNRPWDYLILTASNARQAAAYEGQLAVRRALGLLAGARNVLVVADPPGRRIGSGGSTLLCLLEVLRRELPAGKTDRRDVGVWGQVLRGLRILIVHGGGDSRRLPTYGPCGKIFIPIPGETDTAVPLTLFDRQAPIYLGLPPMPADAGQVVVTAGDVLLRFDPSEVRFAPTGVTGLGCPSPPEQASRHGVFCADADGRVRLFLQKPDLREQAKHGAIDRYGRAILDIGVMSFDAAAAVALLEMCDVVPNGNGGLVWSGPMGQAIETLGLDFYCEICCALGCEATSDHHVAGARAAGSRWDPAWLRRIFEALSPMPFHVSLLPRCEFRHFGTTRQLIDSGLDATRANGGVLPDTTCVGVQNSVEEKGALIGARAWVEACNVRAPLTLEGENVVVGLDIDQPVSLPPRACLDVVQGHGRSGGRVWFVRCYGVDDAFKEPSGAEATFHGRPLGAWLEAVGAGPEDVWDPQTPPEKRRIWEARLFPAEIDPTAYRRWLWMFDPSQASEQERSAWRSADRYSLAEITERTDQEAFHVRRSRLRARQICSSLPRAFREDSDFSGVELGYVLAQLDDRETAVAEVIGEARRHLDPEAIGGEQRAFVGSRILYSLGTALLRWGSPAERPVVKLLPGLPDRLLPADREWLAAIGLTLHEGTSVAEWSDRAGSAAFDRLGAAIVSNAPRLRAPPVSALRPDEIVWGRAPARLDLGGGWTDTPPYSLEHGGCVINAAVDLNGQPPIHCYARVIDEPVIRITSIDLGTRVEVRDLHDLLDYRYAAGEFSLVKAALALSGFSPASAPWPDDVTLPEMLARFGGGIELTTLAAVPKGSGLGTSSIMGAVVLAVIQRVMGRTPTRRELFNAVLRLEQALTTGGGWQDQVGGVVGDVKVITTDPGLVPDPRIHFVPNDVLDPKANGGQTLLYYTGITRLAKNILRQVVGRYLDRDRTAMATLRQLHRLPPLVAESMSRKDAATFGALVDLAWSLNKQLDADSTTEAIDALLARVRPHIYGAKLLGAGGGGFLLMICKSPEDAEAVKRMLQADPPNDRARFFDFNVSREGLVVTVC